jgi:uncharacterized membrane protein
MDLSWLFPYFLFAHVLGAIIAFGPTFTFPIIGRFGAQERSHANFATRLSARISRIQVVPFAILQGITGVGLIIAGKIDVMSKGWLVVGIVLYLIALGYALFIQTSTVNRVIAMTSGGPPSGVAPAGGAPDSGAPASGVPASGPGAGGPPPALLRDIRGVQLGGMFLLVLIISIVYLMVMKPF